MLQHGGRELLASLPTALHYHKRRPDLEALSQKAPQQVGRVPSLLHRIGEQLVLLPVWAIRVKPERVQIYFFGFVPFSTDLLCVESALNASILLRKSWYSSSV